MSRARVLLIAVGPFFLLACVQLSGCGLFQRGNRDVLYLAIGASDALGIGATPLRNGYVFRVRDELEQQTRREVRLLNLAIPGGTTRDLRQTLQLASRREIKPDLVNLDRSQRSYQRSRSSGFRKRTERAFEGGSR
jgi:lysophospholipase L1-like esterase